MASYPNLSTWLREEFRRGCSPGSLMKAMLDSGWSLDDASAALLSAAVTEPQSGDLPTRVPAAEGPLAALRGPALRAQHNIVLAADREVRVLLRLDEPQVAVVADLLSADECLALMSAARLRLARSRTVSAEAAVTAEVNDARTSEGMFFQPGETELVDRIDARIEALFGWPGDHGEALQVLRYGVGAQYKPHYDHFDPATAGGQAALSRGGQRVGTVVIYLAAPAQGGATVFPELGLSVQPQVGHAVFFAYELTNGRRGVLHGGAAVDEGEKWVATKWMREKKIV